MQFITNTIRFLSKKIFTRLLLIILTLFFLSHSAFSQYQATPDSNPITFTAALVLSSHVYTSYNMGKHWQEVASLPDFPGNSIWDNIAVVSDSSLIVVRSVLSPRGSGNTYQSQIYLSTNRGESWKLVYQVAAVLTKVAVSPNRKNIAIVGQTTVYSDDGGHHWGSTEEKEPDSPKLTNYEKQALFVGDSTLIRMGSTSKNTIERSTDGGRSWSSITIPVVRAVTGCSLGGAVSPDASNIIVACKVKTDPTSNNRRGADLYSSRDHGVTWNPISSFNGVDFQEIQMFYLDANKELILLDSFTKPGATSFPFRSLKKSTDGGITWRTLSPIYIPSTDKRRLEYRNISVTGDHVMVLADNIDCNGRRRWESCDEHGAVLTSADKGITWSEYPDEKVAEELVFAFRDATRLLPLSSLPTEATEIPLLSLEVNSVLGTTYSISTCDNQYRCTPTFYGSGYHRRWHIPVGDSMCVITSVLPFGSWRAYKFKVIGPGSGQINYWGTMINPNFNWTSNTLKHEGWIPVNWVRDDNGNDMVTGWGYTGCQCINCDEGS